MQEDLIIAGFGGQGVMSIGQLLAYAGLEEDKNVLWIPAYGPETRGGFANCTVIISDEEIASPVVDHPASLIIMNRPSLERFEKSLIPSGVMILNTSLVNKTPERSDIEVIPVPATESATKMGNVKAANMVLLGAYLERKKIVSLASVVKALSKLFKDKAHLISFNEEALKKGSEFVKELVAED